MSLLSRLPLHPDAARRVRDPDGLRRQPDRGAAHRPRRAARAPRPRGARCRGVLLGVCSLLLRDWRRGAIVATALVAAYAFFGHLAPTLRGVGLTEQMQLAAWAVLVVAAVVFAIRARGALPTATLTLNVFTLILVGLTLLTIVPYESSRVVASGTTHHGVRHAHHRDAGARTGTSTSSSSTVTVRPGRWSIASGSPTTTCPTGSPPRASRSCPALARTTGRPTSRCRSMLSMRMLDDYTRPWAATPATGRRHVPARATGASAAFLQDNGYTLLPARLVVRPDPDQRAGRRDPVLGQGHGVRGGAPGVDHPARHRPAARADPGGEGDEFRDSARARALFQFRQLQRLPSVPGRKFVFAHVLLPHPPYVFDADGNIGGQGHGRRQAGSGAVREPARVHQLAGQGRPSSALLAGPDETDPIVVIMGDEGPFLCRNVDCVDPTRAAPGHPLRRARRVLPARPARGLLPRRPHVT